MGAEDLPAAAGVAAVGEDVDGPPGADRAREEYPTGVFIEPDGNDIEVRMTVATVHVDVVDRKPRVTGVDALSGAGAFDLHPEEAAAGVDDGVVAGGGVEGARDEEAAALRIEEETCLGGAAEVLRSHLV